MLFCLAGAGLGVVTGMFGMQAVATSRGVSPVAGQPSAMIQSALSNPDYEDVYSVTLQAGAFSTLEDFLPYAFQKGTEFRRGASEIVYIDRAPGLTFAVAYVLESTPSASTVSMTTRVSYDAWYGGAYFALIRPVHKRLVPFMISRWTRVSRP